ncbi:MAG: signal recognition particle-docking protein FtsY [Nanoarchaeota archaeon]|nr:signal recognition particle-docking protein FtsY [Nanoarchaeota archaeon]
MFGKIKGKLGDIFKKNEEHIEENADEILQEESNETQDLEQSSENLETQEEKKGFLGGLFSKKKDEEESFEDLDDIKEHQEEDLAEDVQDAVLDGVEEKEKKEIKSGQELTEEEVEKHKEEVEVAIEKEEELEKETNKDIAKADNDEVEVALDTMQEPFKNQKETQVTSINEEQEQELLETLKEDEVGEQPEEKKSFLGRMFGGSKKEESQETLDDKTKEEALPELPQLEEEKEIELESQDTEEKEGFFSKAVNVVKKKKVTQDDYDKIWMDLEIFLLEINVAYEIVEKIGRELKSALLGNSFDRFALSKKVREVMVSEVETVLKTREGNFLEEVKEHKQSGEPLRIMVLGVNGTGKTTSIGKVIKYLQKHDLSVVVAAADTFRAAAVDQIAKHCENLGVKCIQHQNGGDPAAVAFDAVEHAKAKGVDVVLIDTAGRMPNNSNLMLELQKIKRVSKSQMALFIGDSISGNDLIDQISLFDKGVEINGVALTKVDTDERPGSVVTCAYAIKKPIYFLGIGQGYDDLVEFRAKEVAEKLFDIEE